MDFLWGLWGKNNSKHKKLCEEWALANSCESVVPSTSSSTTSASTSASASASSSRTGPVEPDAAPETTYELKYIGSTLVQSPNSEDETAEAVKTVMTMSKAGGKKVLRVSLAVSLRGIRMTDLTTGEEQLRVSIYRISYCSADGRYGNVFAFIATNLNETMECHAFLCPKRKVAQTVTLTVAQAFNTAYELWQLAQLDSKMYHEQDKSPKLTEDDSDADKKSTKGGRTKSKVSPGEKSDSEKSLLIDVPKEPVVKAKVESWVSFEADAAEGTSDPDGGIPLKAISSPTSPTSPTSSKSSPTKENSLVQPCPEPAVVPSPAPDIVCSS